MGLAGLFVIAVLAVTINATTLDTNNLNNLDVYVRRYILNRILGKLNDTTIHQTVQSKACETKVKNSFTICQTCHDNLCQQKTSGTQPKLNGFLGSLTPLIFKPNLVVGEIIDAIGTGLPSALSLLGSSGKAFLSKFGGLANELGHTFSGLTSAFQDLSWNLKTFGTNLMSNAGNLLHQFQSGATNVFASTGAGSLLTQVGQGAQGLLNGLKQTAINTLSTLGNGLKALGNTAANLFGSIFGKRQSLTHLKRCNTACPVCDTIDLQTNSKEQVLLTVCGQQYVTDQSKTVQYLKSLQQLYNTTLSAKLLTQIDYDASSNLAQNETSFSKWNFSFLNNGNTETLQTNYNLRLTDLKATAEKIADKIWAAKNI